MDSSGRFPFEVDAALESEAAAYHTGNTADDDGEEDWIKELYPPTSIPAFRWRSPQERAEAAFLRNARTASRKRLSRLGSGFHALSGDGSLASRRTLAEFDAFKEAETYGNRKRKRIGAEEWPLRGNIIEKESLPKELWIAVSDGEESRQYAKTDLRWRVRKRRALLDSDEEQDGQARGRDEDEDNLQDNDDEEENEELKDDDFDEDDNDANNDYNAEKYFDNGDGGEDDYGGDEGGNEGGNEY